MCQCTLLDASPACLVWGVLWVAASFCTYVFLKHVDVWIICMFCWIIGPWAPMELAQLVGHTRVYPITTSEVVLAVVSHRKAHHKNMIVRRCVTPQAVTHSIKGFSHQKSRCGRLDYSQHCRLQLGQHLSCLLNHSTV